jgi:hypothetical protein
MVFSWYTRSEDAQELQCMLHSLSMLSLHGMLVWRTTDLS